MAKQGSGIGIFLGLAGAAGLITLIAVASKVKAAPGPMGGPGTFTVTIVNPPAGSVTWNATFTQDDGTSVHPSNTPAAGYLLFATGEEDIQFTVDSLSGTLTIATLAFVGSATDGGLSITLSGLYSIKYSFYDTENLVFDCSQYKNQLVNLG